MLIIPLDDIKAIVEPVSQVDPTFRTDQNYCPLKAGEVRLRLIEDKNYTDEKLPEERTIRTKLNELGFKPQKVAKSKPLKILASRGCCAGNEPRSAHESLHAVDDPQRHPPHRWEKFPRSVVAELRRLRGVARCRSGARPFR